MAAIMLLGPQEDVPQIAYDETDAAYGAPPPNGDDDDGDDDDDEYYYGRQKIGKPKGKTQETIGHKINNSESNERLE